MRHEKQRKKSKEPPKKSEQASNAFAPSSHTTTLARPPSRRQDNRRNKIRSLGTKCYSYHRLPGSSVLFIYFFSSHSISLAYFFLGWVSLPIVRHRPPGLDSRLPRRDRYPLAQALATGNTQSPPSRKSHTTLPLPLPLISQCQPASLPVTPSLSAICRLAP